MQFNKEEINRVIAELEKQAKLDEETSKDVTPEQLFAQELAKNASANNDVNAQVLDGINAYIKTQEEEMFNKNANLVGNDSAVHPYPGDEPQLGKTVTTTNEIPKGNITPDKNAIVAGIIAQLTADKVNHGASTVTVAGATQTIPVKQAELYKSAAEQLVGRLFEKYASEIQTEEEAEVAFSNLTKYSAYAEDVLESQLGDGGYDITDVEKVACALIEKDVDDYAEELTKQAEAQEYFELAVEKTAERTVDLLLEKMAAYNEQDQELEKQAEDTTYALLEKAAGMLENTGQPYTQEDIVEVAEALLDNLSQPSVVEQALQNG